MLHVLLSVLVLAAGPADTAVVLGSSRVDLTGDGRAEVLELLGTVHAADSLSVRFVVRDGDRVLYDRFLAPITGRRNFDGPPDRLSAAEYRDRVDGFAPSFLHTEKVRPALEFEAWLGRAAPNSVAAIPTALARDAGGGMELEEAMRIWQDLRRRNVPVFEFSPGGDGLLAIAWSEADGRFFNLLDCC